MACPSTAHYKAYLFPLQQVVGQRYPDAQFVTNITVRDRYQLDVQGNSTVYIQCKS